MDDYGHVMTERRLCHFASIREYRGTWDWNGLAMRAMLSTVKAQSDIARASLAIQKANYAVKMYACGLVPACGGAGEEFVTW